LFKITAGKLLLVKTSIATGDQDGCHYIYYYY